MAITHAFVNPKSDGGDTDQTQPSDWNADHVGGIPDFVSVFPILGSIAATNWATIGSAAVALGGYVWQSSGAQDAESAWDLLLRSGTYSLFLIHYTEGNRGIYTVLVDGAGSSGTTIDGYEVTPGTGQKNGTSTGIVIPTSGIRRVSLKMATKNAGSSAYYGSISAFSMIRTGA